jgi:hypothetical protein
MVYGGPHVRLVQKSWGCTADLRAHHLRLSGYLVLKVRDRTRVDLYDMSCVADLSLSLSTSLSLSLVTVNDFPLLA